MRRVVLATAISIIALPTMADDAPPREPRVAIVNVKRVFEENAEFRDRIEELRGKVQELSRQAKTMEAMLKGLQEGLAKASGPAERAQFEQDIVRVGTELNSLKELAKRRLTRAEAAIYRDEYLRTQRAVAAEAHERGLKLVVRQNGHSLDSKSEDPKQIIEAVNNVIVFVAPELDITDAVIERLAQEPSDDE